MRVDAKDMKRKQLLTLMDMQSNKIFAERGNMFKVALLDKYKHLVTNTDLSVSSLDFIKSDILT